MYNAIALCHSKTLGTDICSQADTIKIPDLD